MVNQEAIKVKQGDNSYEASSISYNYVIFKPALNI